eukprot:2800630-Ditylum_brightwellii.AAC.1
MPTLSGAHGNTTRKKRSKLETTVKAGKELQSKLSSLHVRKLQKITEEPEEQTKASTPKPITACQKINNCVDEQ